MMNFDTNKSPIEVLLIEDNPGDVRLTKEVLKDARVFINLNVVFDGEEALKYLYKQGKYSEAAKPDLILLDLNLPRKNGREVLVEIKSNPTLKMIPVIILTTSQAEADILRSYELNVNCYITKPVQLNDFINVVRNIEDFWLSVVKLPTKF